MLAHYPTSTSRLKAPVHKRLDQVEAIGEAIAEFERGSDAGTTNPDGGSGSVDS